MKIKTLLINNEEFEIHQNSNGEICFGYIYHYIDEWNFEETKHYSDISTYSNQSPLPILTRITQSIIEWIKIKKPYYFYIKANTQQKHRIFIKIINKHIHSLSNQYSMLIDKDTVHFYCHNSIKKQ